MIEKTQKNKKWIKGLAFAALVLIPAIGVYFLGKAQWIHKQLPYYGPDYTGTDISKVTHTVGPIQLLNQHGKVVTMNDFDSSIVVANIFFATCPQVCPEMNKQVQAVAELFLENPDVKFLTITIDPEHDSVPVLKEVADYFKADLYKRQFCTGSKREIYDWVINDLMLATEQRGADFIHDDRIVIIDKEKHIRAILPTRGATNTEKMKLIKRIQDDIANLVYEYRKKELDKR